MNYFLLGAAVLAALIVAVHLFAGGRDVARPLLQSTELDDTVAGANSAVVSQPLEFRCTLIAINLT